MLANLKRAYQNHFNPKMRTCFPKFKTKKSPRQSFRIPQRVVLQEGKVYVPKLGWVKVRQSQEIDGATKSATFKRTATGKWYVTLVREFEILECKPKISAEQVVGGDFGLSTFLINAIGRNQGGEPQIPSAIRQETAPCTTSTVP